LFARAGERTQELLVNILHRSIEIPIRTKLIFSILHITFGA
jgi:hypothetical protein